jgi:hypothetical protein
LDKVDDDGCGNDDEGGRELTHVPGSLGPW